MTPQIYIGLNTIDRLSYLNKSQNIIINIMCNSFNVSHRDITSKSRIQYLTRIRHITAYFLKQKTSLTLFEIGNLLGGRDHSTVIYSIDKVNNRQFDKVLSEMYDRVEKQIEKI